jgi:hypothetical protein
MYTSAPAAVAALSQLVYSYAIAFKVREGSHPMPAKRHLPARSLAAVVFATVTAAASAASTSVPVPGISDIWLAGQPNGTILNGGFPGSDVAPLNSPVLASMGLNLAAGTALTVNASGFTDYNGCASPSPDGGLPCGAAPFPAALGISGYNGPINALVGVFLDNSVPGGAAPPSMDFSTPASLAQTTISPQLRQVFFVGDGLTGTGTGIRQQFIIPAGATRLYLASSDGVGASYNNFGSFSVTVVDAFAVSLAPVPVNDPWALALTALLLALAGTYAARLRGGARRR